ncbi:MAG: sensor histidine kinase N-terminal domain-containing protein [Zoogloeaceae bacterium]|nr:sensor histidine kinase N-terminal domain-containing protein [Rhodocyclaceae bacterium]MCP5235143.1 sensor histidine kinase N-terminal domain-containing protein [Zoogloeaceae bacterium]
MWPKRRRLAEAGKQGGETHYNSLFGEILDWMLAPLLFLWPISIIITHNVAASIANTPYDRSMADSLRALAQMISVDRGEVSVNFPAPARALFRSDQDDVMYFQVTDLAGRVISGDKDIPPALPPRDLVPGDVLFRDGVIQGEEVRIAYLFLRAYPRTDSPLVLLQLGETRNKRSDLASRVVTGVLLPQFAIIPLAVVLVWLGLTRGIAPLSRLQRILRRRRPSDLSPISTIGVPEEVRPLIIAFNEMMERLEENLQAQQRFIADAAHQMRTPLTGLRMQTELALLESEPEALRSSLRQIAESAERASHLINQLLSLARAESSSEKIYAVERVDLSSLVKNVVEELFPRALAKQIDLGIEATEVELSIDGNPVLLRELIKNLVDNAIKYTPVAGQVTVRTQATDFAILEVEDSGIGIPEADRERVFERFYRVLGSGEDGSGLGLPIVREIAELHRARATLNPNPSGRGTIAQVVFPRSLQSAGASRELVPVPG